MPVRIRQIITPVEKKQLYYYSDLLPIDIIKKTIQSDNIINIELHWENHVQLLPIYISKIKSPDIPDLYETVIWKRKAY